ncbi:MAG: archease, partial [Candidatus Omnitrophota bacterium]
NAAYGMFDIIADLSNLKISVATEVSIEAGSREELLVRWLDELLYNFYVKGIIYSRFEISRMDDNSLKGAAHGRHVGDNRSRLKREIKAATFHGLEIKEENGGYVTEIVFDV